MCGHLIGCFTTSRGTNNPIAKGLKREYQGPYDTYCQNIPPTYKSGLDGEPLSV